MSSRWIALAIGALLASQKANAACVIHGARPTVPLPTMLSGQEFSFIASHDCETLRFTIRGTDLSKNPTSSGPVGPGPHTYKVVLTESEWDAVVAESGSTLTWVVTGRTSAGVMTRLATTNDLNLDEPITIELSGADAKLMAPDNHGATVSGAGDMDGDGRDDLLVGAPYADKSGAVNCGKAYLILGPVTGTHDLDLAADATFVGVDSDDYAGAGVSGVGDVDGDSHADLLIGANITDEGSANLFLGPVTGTLDLSLADAQLVGEEADDHVGLDVSGAGDVDGDGHDDLLVGTRYHGLSGVAYLVLGPVSGTLDLSLADAKLVGEATGDEAGVSVSGAGDVNADGHDDLLVGAKYNDEGGGRAGAVYLVHGPVTGTHDLSVANAKLVGEAYGDMAGVSVSGAGDVDGDGHHDMLVGANGNDEGGGYAGAAYLVLGSVTGAVDLSVADAKLVGEEMADNAGINVAGAGDVDGDSHDDLLVGMGHTGRSPGPREVYLAATYLVIGPVTGTLDLSLADVKLVGMRREHGGVDSAKGAGDVDGDGRDDVLIGAPGNDRGAAAAYLMYGGGL